MIGPDILCWSTGFFTKNARDPSYVSWHQDSTYWGLEPPDIVTAWVALSDSTLANGAMRVIPGTHLMDQLAHHDTFAPDNLLSRGQEIAVEVDEREAVALELRAGEMSLHHVRLIHGSDPNPSDAGASDSPSATSRPMSARWWAGTTARPWCAARTAITISSPNSGRRSTWRRRRSPTTPRLPACSRRS